MSIVSSVAFVPRGFAAEFPKTYELDEAEYERINNISKLKLEDARAQLENPENEQEKSENSAGAQDQTASSGAEVQTAEEMDDELKEYKLDNYDDEEEEEEDDSLAMFSNIKGVQYHENGENDPYVTMNTQEEEEMEREEMQIYPTDNLLLAARTEDNLSHVEVYIYESQEENLYVHHDFLLPSFPLCLEWLDYKVGTSDDTPGNYVAVGTFDTEIEIWNLDVVDAVYPAAVLGANAANSGSNKKKKKAPKVNPKTHTDAILALSSNRNAHNLLASGSADTSIKLWNLSSCTCVKSFTYHTDKVSSLSWHPKMPSVLLSGSYDKTARIADLRADAPPLTLTIDSDVENVAWDPHNENNFFVGSDAGILYYCDARDMSKPVWQLQAHDGPISCLSVNPNVPSFVATGSTDRMVKLWNTSDHTPKLIVSRDLDVGRVFTCSFVPDESISFHLAASGSKGLVRVWDTATNSGVRRAFESRIGKKSVAPKERVVQLEDAGANDESDEEDEEDDEYEDIEANEDDDSADEIQDQEMA
ncbi:WD repeat protein [Schizosaccharomyces cryophilus OY26]|uniref:WD repeat protein n=1 Tax=Schizosaccharomyces cryophilus (strain OY26 / ATCC MYA-4695 / CBS 11777 / NBRC 106824 / NRRL Y48691) TaxID=653667 RepID=S9VTP9_SCHCR|nr:WD repeat protein [Schizosaccharomyces cryophilus OY26]EPY49539.1 WD repeat protein [Schizosaccharomyces cryophilus OY26]